MKLYKPTWEACTFMPSSMGGGSVLAYDKYNEIGDNNVYMYVGGSNTYNLQRYNPDEDSYSMIYGGGLSFTTVNTTDYPGFALAYTSLGQLSQSTGGVTYIFANCISSNTIVVTGPSFTRDITGSKVRIVSGKNAGYEGTITSHPIGGYTLSNSATTLTVTPDLPFVDIGYIEVYSGGLFAMLPNGTSVAHKIYFFDIATDRWTAKADTILNSVMTAHTKLVTVPQIGNTIDTGTITAFATNHSSNGNSLEYWTIATGTTVDTLGWADPDGDYLANRICWYSGTGRIYTGTQCFKPNTQYTVSYYVKLKTGSVASSIQFYIFTAQWQYSIVSSVTSSASWERKTHTFTTGDIGTNWHEINFYVTASDAVTPCETFFYGFQIDEGASALPLLQSSYSNRSSIENLIPYTDMNHANWYVQGGATKTGNQTDPTGGTSAVLITDASTGSTGSCRISNIAVNPNNKQFTFSVWLKAGTTTTVGLHFEQGNSPWAGTGTTVTVDNNWKRYSFTSTLSSVSDTFVTVIIRAGAAYGQAPAGTGLTAYAAYPQFEYGGVMNPHVSANGSTGIRKQYSNNFAGPVSKLTIAGKNWQPGSLANSRLRITLADSYMNLIPYGSNISDSNTYQLRGTASKTGNTLNLPGSDDRIDILPLNFGKLPAGTYTFQAWVSSTQTGVFYLETYSYKLGRTNVIQYNISPTSTRVQYTMNVLADGFVTVLGRRTDGVTNITIDAVQLEYGTTVHPFINTTSIQGYGNGVRYYDIIDNDTDTITIQAAFHGTNFTIGDSVIIEPNGDNIYAVGNVAAPMYLYNQRKNAWLNTAVHSYNTRGSVPGWEFSADFVNDIPGWSLVNTSVTQRQPNTSYTYGDKVYYKALFERYGSVKSIVFECTTPGTTSSSSVSGWEPFVSVAGTYTDGTAVFTRRQIETNNRFIYSFRGNSTNTIHVFDIAASTWHSIDQSISYKAAGQGAVQFTTGSTFVRDKNYIHITVPIQFGKSHNYRFDIKNNSLEPFTVSRIAPSNSSLTTGQRNFVVTRNGNTYLYNTYVNNGFLYRTKL